MTDPGSVLGTVAPADKRQLLRQYRRGEIDREEFQRRLAALLHSQGESD